MKNKGMAVSQAKSILSGGLTSPIAQVSVHTVGDESFPLPELFAPVPGFTWSFTIDQPGYLIAFGHVDTEHRGIAGTADKAIFAAFQLKLNGRWLPGSKTGENILNRTDHYYAAQIHGFKRLKAGDYTLELHGRSASTAARGVNGLAQVRATYNQVVYIVVPLP